MRIFNSKFMLYVIMLTLSINIFANDTSVQTNKPIKNIILMIADGFSPAGATMARYVKGENLNLDSILVGTLQTKSNNSLITDSAAAATALATGYKTNNKIISQHPTTYQNLKTLIEAAQEKNMATGIVVTDKITGATPACFSAHIKHRDLKEEIAVQQVNSNIDLLFGGGYNYFLPKSKNGKRSDQQDLIAIAEEYGIAVIKNKSELKKLNKTPVLGLFAGSELEYVIDRQDHKKTTQPSLVEMTAKALELLSKNDNGFVLIIEGSRIDHAAHSNDPAAFVQEILSYDQTIGLVKEFINTHPSSLMLSMADHATGGITVGADVNNKVKYEYKPQELTKIKHSATYLNDYLDDHKHTIGQMISETGLNDLTSDEIRKIKYDKNGKKNKADEAVQAVMNIVSERSRTGWTTVGHSAADINLYAFGANSEQFNGNHDNTFIAKKVAELLQLKLS